MKLANLMLALAVFFLVACGQQSDEPGSTAGEDDAARDAKAYVVLDEDLQQLRDDFNANQGRIRLIFLSGPTCGICLRGMADLNDAFIAEAQNDDRLVTFVVHVPALGAREEHVADTIPLLNGPRVHHYWEDSGIIGKHYSDVMDVGMYVWDFWTIYGPDARWEGSLPPKPDYYEHQLDVSSNKFRVFPKDRVLNSERFASEAAKYIEQVNTSRFAAGGEVRSSENELQGDGTVIPVVAQPRNVAVSEHIRGRGGYKKLKRIKSISKRGRWLVDGGEYPLQIDAERPNLLTRSIDADGQDYPGLPAALAETLRDAFEFDGPLVEWPDKDSKLEKLGMAKLGDVLAWKLDLTQSGGQHWHLYLNSHGGALVRADLLGDNDQVEYRILQSNVRETDGFKYPHRIEYQTGDGTLLAVEIIDEITIVQEAYDLTEDVVTH